MFSNLSNQKKKVGNTDFTDYESQCENFMIFLSLTFYVKSILRILNFDSCEFLHFFKAGICKSNKSQSLQVAKTAAYTFSKIDFT